MEESTFDSEHLEVPDPDITDIDLARPSAQERSFLRASVRNRASHRPTLSEYGTFENVVFQSDDLGPDHVAETTFTNQSGNQEPSIVRFRELQKRPTSKENAKLQWNRFCSRVKDVFSVFGVSQKIQCFGGGVYSYFNFVSWLGKINFVISLLYMCALILPYAFVQGPDSFDKTAPVNRSAEWKEAINCSDTYKSELQSYIANRTNVQKVIDILQGTGLVEKAKFIFIGSYFDKILWQSSKNPDVRYDASLAFFLCLWVSLGLTLIVTIVASGQRILKRVNTQEEKSRFTFKVLARWDYIIQDKRRAKVEKRNIHRELKSCLEEEERMEKKYQMSSTQKRALFCKRFGVWCSYIFLLVGCLVAIYFANVKSLELSSVVIGKEGLMDLWQLLVQYLPSIVIVVANFFVAFYCRKIVTVEEYDANREILITLLRTVVLRFASLFVLMVSIFALLRKCFIKSKTDAHTCVAKDSECKNAPCWETYIGQQFYKLVFLDFLLFVGIILLHLFQKLVEKKISFLGKPEFDIANNVLDLVYSQTLCWLGMFFCPLLPIVTFVKVVLIYVLRKILVVYHIYEHDAKSANAAQTDSYFLDILLVSLIFVTILPLAVATSIFSPSTGCGPYRVVRSLNDLNSIHSRAVVNLPMDAQKVYSYIDSLIVMAPIWIVLGFFTYYYYTLSQAREQLKKVLLKRMTLEMKDLVFCRNRVKYAKRAVALARRGQNL